MKTLLTIALACSLVACSLEASESQDADADADVSVGVTADHVVASGAFDVACGCSLESVGHCGNYIQIDSEFLEVGNSEELGLDHMAWCEQKGVRARAAGQVKDGKFVGESLVTLK
jgi:hypothetical protein